jgi:hypothetical protein
MNAETRKRIGEPPKKIWQEKSGKKNPAKVGSLAG